jgi:hypothetical protein
VPGMPQHVTQRGNHRQPALLHERRRRKLAQARHSRRERNLQIRQLTFPLQAQETRTSLACH